MTPEAQHGTYSRYTSPKHKCRCQACKEAAAAYRRAYRASNPDQVKATRRNAYRKSVENGTLQQYVDQNRAAINERSRQYAVSDKGRQARRKHYDANKEAVLASKKARRDPEYCREYAARYRAHSGQQTKATRKAKTAPIDQKATRSRKPWTRQEVAIALDPTLSAIHAAALLGRTVRAVELKRSRTG